MQTAMKAEKPRKQAISGRFWAGRTYRGRIKDDHKIDIVLRAIEFLIIYIVYEYKTLIQQSESPWNYSNHQTVYLLPTGYGFASLPSSRFALCAEHSVFLNS